MDQAAGDFEKADTLFVQVLARMRAPMPRADAYYDQAVLTRNRHRLQEAKQYTQESLKIAQRIATPVGATPSLVRLEQVQPGSRFFFSHCSGQWNPHGVECAP